MTDSSTYGRWMTSHMLSEVTPTTLGHTVLRASGSSIFRKELMLVVGKCGRTVVPLFTGLVLSVDSNTLSKDQVALLKRVKTQLIQMFKLCSRRRRSQRDLQCFHETELHQAIHCRATHVAMSQLYKLHFLRVGDLTRGTLSQVFTSKDQIDWFVSLGPKLVDFVGGFVDCHDWPVFVASPMYEKACVPSRANFNRSFVPTFEGPAKLADLLRDTESWVHFPRIGQTNKFSHLRPLTLPQSLKDLRTITQEQLASLGIAFRNLWDVYFREPTPKEESGSASPKKRNASTSLSPPPPLNEKDFKLQKIRMENETHLCIDLSRDKIC